MPLYLSPTDRPSVMLRLAGAKQKRATAETPPAVARLNSLRERGPGQPSTTAGKTARVHKTGVSVESTRVPSSVAVSVCH
jgi:hypothetical protein